MKHQTSSMRCVSQERSEVKAVGEHCHHILARIPVLEWFVQSPADESSVETWLRSMLSR